MDKLIEKITSLQDELTSLQSEYDTLTEQFNQIMTRRREIIKLLSQKQGIVEALTTVNSEIDTAIATEESTKEIIP